MAVRTRFSLCLAALPTGALEIITIGLYSPARSHATGAGPGASMAGKTSVAIDSGVARITLDDGKVNALSVEMITEIEAALDAAAKAGALTVIKGRDGIFSAG